MLLNSAVVLLGAIVGTFLTLRLSSSHSIVTLALLFSTCGALITFAVNYLAFWGHFRPLIELSRALEAIRDGQRARQAIDGMRASGLGDVIASAHMLLDLIEDTSLQFSARLLGSIEAERQRIGRELHDNTSQLLAAALLNLGLVERQLTAGVAPRPSLQPALALINRALDQLKGAIYDMRPTMLDDLGLAAALRWYAKARADQPGLRIDMRLDDAGRRLPPHIEIALYRVAQEALANVVAHAAATRGEVELEIKPGFVALRIIDNGCGFDLNEARGRGLGLLSMRERIAALGGTFNIVTEPGAGTRVYAVVLLPEGWNAKETKPT
ncbi:MAG: sensor histidine kinase [Deltaproteobacteria bacterium]|nr:sensor histidine kinase [Deltaproteobacteria bacterium]